MQIPRNDPLSLPAVERRCGEERRNSDDRRELIRYEPRLELRRKSRDRRAHHGWDDFPLR